MSRRCIHVRCRGAECIDLSGEQARNFIVCTFERCTDVFATSSELRRTIVYVGNIHGEAGPRSTRVVFHAKPSQAKPSHATHVTRVVTAVGSGGVTCNSYAVCNKRKRRLRERRRMAGTGIERRWYGSVTGISRAYRVSRQEGRCVSASDAATHEGRVHQSKSLVESFSFHVSLHVRNLREKLLSENFISDHLRQ